jgi:hypothetical protein
MRLATSTAEGTWECQVCGLTGKGTTQHEVEAAVRYHLAGQHDRILVSLEMRDRGKPIYEGIYSGKPLTAEERRFLRNQRLPSKQARGLPPWRRRQ